MTIHQLQLAAKIKLINRVCFVCHLTYFSRLTRHISTADVWPIIHIHISPSPRKKNIQVWSLMGTCFLSFSHGSCFPTSISVQSQCCFLVLLPSSHFLLRPICLCHGWESVFFKVRLFRIAEISLGSETYSGGLLQGRMKDSWKRVNSSDRRHEEGSGGVTGSDCVLLTSYNDPPPSNQMR